MSDTTHEPVSTRPQTPESLWTSSLQDASATVDDLTAALANFSRVPSPELPTLLSCCCGKDECENHQSWVEFKAKLEGRLILSAEVGQALLQRHEAYVRRHNDIPDSQKELEAEVHQLRTQNASLEKRLTQALVNSEVIETSNKVVLQELSEARSNLTRLTTQQVRSVGIEARLTTVTQEKEDIQQERDSADQRARLAEARIVALRDRCSKMQDQLNGLHRDLEEQRSHRLELSEEILQGARAQLKVLHHPTENQLTIDQDDEVIKMLESLVAANEALKRDSREMQQLLSESREDSRALQEELEEFRASENRRYSRHRANTSVHSSIQLGPLSPGFNTSFNFGRYRKRAVSAERGFRRDFEPMTPELGRRPVSPDDTLWSPSGKTDPGLVTPSRIQFDFEEGSQLSDPTTPERTRAQRPLLLLSRNKGVQTEPWKGLLAPSPIPTLHMESATSSHDGRSESSSMTDAQPGAISALMERATSLLHRLVMSDALTLTNRLKRQHLTGADVGHLSRTTVCTIVSEATMLRTNFRTLLEDDKTTTTCTRKDLRALFKLLKDAFTEMGDLRMTLNDVILDPSIAPKLSEMLLNPSKAGEATSSTAPSWMAPIARLFGGQSTPDDGFGARTSPLPVRSNSRGKLSTSRPTSQRMIPKLGPALSASATTVNVEFQTGGGRAVTNTYSAHPSNEKQGSGSSNLERLASGASTPSRAPSSVMGIFAGAPKPIDTQDPWIVVPKPQRKPLSPLAALDDAAYASAAASLPASTVSTNASSPVVGTGAATMGRSTRRTSHSTNKLSRIVDAVIDVESPEQTEPPSDFQTTLLQRTLRPRGLSDSSIRTTFLNHGEHPSEQERVGKDIPRAPAGEEQPSSSESVLATFSRKMMALRSVSSFVGKPSLLAIPRTTTPKTAPSSAKVDEEEGEGNSPLAPGRFFPSVPTWSATYGEPGMDIQSGPSSYVGSSGQWGRNM